MEVVQPPKTVEGIIATMVVTLDLRSKIVDAQRKDKVLEKMCLKVKTNDFGNYHEEADNVITFEGRLCVPHNEELKNEIMSEAHDTPCTAHPGA